MSDPTSRLNAALSGRYRIERQLGEGGMATVYLARDLKHDRNVALKVLKPELAAVVGAERFLAEIKTTANLQHPHILPLHDSGAADGLLFYVMPYVEGETLRDRLDREHQLPVDEAVQIAKNVAEALDYAHSRGVIHRDIKPENILLQTGKPVISDFGIALAVTQGGAGRLTETGLSLGTPHYMSPEQATGDLNVGAATDVYALGCVLYEMLVGEPPYTGSTPQAILGKIIQAKLVSATEARRSVPPNVDAAIRRALEKVPADRFASAQAFATALGDASFRHGEVAGVGGFGTAGVGPWKRLTVAFTSLATVFALVAAWALMRPEPPRPVERFVADTFEPTTGSVSLLPDGSGMVYGTNQVMVRRWNSLVPAPISGATDGQGFNADAVVSPSGGEVAYVTSTNELRVLSLAGGVGGTLAEDACCMVRWGTDGFVYFAPRERTIRRVPERGGPVEEVTTRENGEGPQGAFQILADGDVGVFTANWDSRGAARIEALRLSTGERKVLASGAQPYVTPTGHLVFATMEGQIMAAPFDAGAMELTAAPVPVVEGILVRSAVPVYSVSADGSLLYVEGGAYPRLAVMDLEGNLEILPLPTRSFTGGGPTWSPDGASVTFSSDDQIYTYNTVLNSPPRQITFDGLNRSPVYSPDGARLVFSSRPVGADATDLFVKDLSSDAPPRVLITLDGSQSPTQWPSDTLILFENRATGGNGDLWLLDLSDPDAPEARPYLDGQADLEEMQLSPDGRLAAYRSLDSAGYHVQVRSFPTPGEPTTLYGGGRFLYWAPDGRTLYYVAGPAAPWFAARMERGPVPAVLSVDTLFINPPLAVPPASGPALHPDGDRIIVAALGGSATVGDDAAPLRIILVKNFFEDLKARVPIP